MRVRLDPYHHHGAAVLFVLLGVGPWAACDLEMYPDDCDTDSDCPNEGRCIAGWFRRSCASECSNDAHCGTDEVCGHASSATADRCTPKCEQNADCPEGEVCRVDGHCKPGCRVDADCDGGLRFCNEGRCDTGCRTNGDCPADAGTCVPDTFLDSGWGDCRDVCATDDHCAVGFVCVANPTRQFNQCRQLPEPLPCGNATCTAGIAREYDGASVLLFPCCASGSLSQCGYEVHHWSAALAVCQPPGQSGESDPECEIEFTRFPPCRAPSGECGLQVDPLIECAHAPR